MHADKTLLQSKTGKQNKMPDKSLFICKDHILCHLLFLSMISSGQWGVPCKKINSSIWPYKHQVTQPSTVLWQIQDKMDEVLSLKFIL